MDTPRAHVLIVEDDEHISGIVERFLGTHGFACDQALCGTDALKLLQSQTYDVIVCDLMLPDMKGEAVIELARSANPTVSIVVTSARAQVNDRVEVLGLGADDYLVKPFELEELLVRIEVQLRHRGLYAQGSQASDDEKSFGRWTLKPAERVLLVDGEEVPLTATEFDIVALLIGHPRQAYTKEQIFENVWNEPAIDTGSVQVHISNIRNKLKASGTESYIKTVWHYGYRLDLGEEH